MEPELFLSPFAPIVQFLAGIYLLFTYEKFLDNSPIKKLQDNIAKQLSDFLYSVQASVPTEDIESLKQNKLAWSWVKNVTIIRSMSLFMLLYCCFLLLIMGCENQMKYSCWYFALPMLNTFAIIYCLFNLWGIWIFIFLREKLYTFGYFFIFVIIGFVAFNYFINDFFVGKNLCVNSWSFSWTTTFCVFTVFVPILLFIGEVIYVLFYLKLFSYNFQYVRDKRKIFSEYLMDPENTKVPDTIERKFVKEYKKKNCSRDLTEEEKIDIMKKEIDDAIKKFIEASFFSLLWQMICKK